MQTEQTEIITTNHTGHSIDFSMLPSAILPSQKYKFEQKRTPTVIELFAGSGGMALGFEAVGFKPVLLNEFNKDCCQTLRLNRADWTVKEADIRTVDFTPYCGKVDVVTGGFPCQSFSTAGKRLGFKDERGALFFEFARAIEEIKPLLFVGENVKGLMQHDKGKTLETIIRVLDHAGYRVLTPKIMKAVEYGVPQARERIFIIGIRKDIHFDFDLDVDFHFPEAITHQENTYTLRDALKKGRLYDCDVPKSPSRFYSKWKTAILAHIPAGCNWQSLPHELRLEYLGKDYKKIKWGSYTAKRLSWDSPSPTLITNPESKISERCHPDETRPLTVREYARIQTFPDDWQFCGSITSQYRQIGNAVPVNLARAIAFSVHHCLSDIYRKYGKQQQNSDQIAYKCVI